MKSSMFGAGALLMVAAAPAAGQEGNPAAGLELAEQLCTACHIVGPERVGSDIAPPFAALAGDPETTYAALHAWPGGDHPVMGDMALTRRQIDDINAYLDSLRAGVTVPAEGDEGRSPRAGSGEPAPALDQAPAERLGEPIVPTPDDDDPAVD